MPSASGRVRNASNFKRYATYAALAYTVAAASTPACLAARIGDCQPNTREIQQESTDSQPKITKLSAGETGIFYVTDRQLETSKKETSYNAERSNRLDYGQCAMSDGDIDNPSPYSGQEEFFKALEAARTKAGDNRVTVYVHGYACSFQKSAKVAAELAQHVTGPVVMFSWPSRNRRLTYMVDECNAEWATSQFADFLDALSQRIGTANITIVAHSMGTQLVCSALQSMTLKELLGGTERKRYNHIVFCSPDLDTQTFLNKAPLLVAVAKDLSVLVSAKDARLGLSRFVHGNSRLGLSKKGTPDIPGVQIIDFTANDHSAFGHAIPYTLVSEIINSGTVALSSR